MLECGLGSEGGCLSKGSENKRLGDDKSSINITSMSSVAATGKHVAAESSVQLIDTEFTELTRQAQKKLCEPGNSQH